MIIDKNINPERDLYFLGGVLIDILQNSNEEEHDFLELYEEFRRKKRVSINLFSLALDWLFILGVVTNGGKGGIKKCF